MKVTFYPGSEDIEGSHGIEKLISELRRKYPRLWSLVRTTIDKISSENVTNLDLYIRMNWVSRLSHIEEPLYEFRIPPKAKGGVVRLYFAYVHGSVMVLSGEIKIGKSNANSTKISTAVTKYREVFKK
jgi:hypothetical protein